LDFLFSLERVERLQAEIVASLADKLRMGGVLIRKATTPMQEPEDIRELWEEMTVEEWLNLASMPLL
jgi:hypothetical protein